MNTLDPINDLLISALETEGYFTTVSGTLKWIGEIRNRVNVEVEQIPFARMKKWGFDKTTGNLCHETKKFFSIAGIKIETNFGKINQWSQPIINQPEIGFLGIITKKINGVLHFLMQAKIEPGNINVVQLSPTLQATKSNYTKVHLGKSPLYLEYFNGERKVKILLDQLQSEQGARFYRKRNRNIIVEIYDDIPVNDNFCWLTLGQIKQLLRFDNVVNMDTRAVISGISYNNFNSPLSAQRMIGKIDKSISRLPSNVNREMLISALPNNKPLNSFEMILSWITSLKTLYDLDISKIPLNQVKDWIITETEIHHAERKYFSVIATDVYIENREVDCWSQPMMKSAQEGVIGFLVKSINGVYHFLVQAKVEAGNLDILELAPTVQCLTGNYRKGYNEYEVPFLDVILSCKQDNIIYRSMQSEEGGRFFQEQNINIIVKVEEDFPIDVPINYCWMTINQLLTFIRFNNFLNIQTRSLLSAIEFI